MTLTVPTPIPSQALDAGPDPAGTARGSDFARLSQQIAAAGLFKRRHFYYARTITVIVGAFAACWVAFALVGDSWWTLLVAAVLAVATTQVAFLGHDVGHRQIFRTRKASETAGMLLGNLGIGMSTGWWIDKHTRHHANPNHTDHDPDVEAGVLVWSEEQASTRKGIAAWFARSQAYLFFPLILLEGLSLHVNGIRAAFGKETPIRRRWAECLFLVVHVVAYLSAVFLVLSPGKAIAFIAVHQGLWGFYMGASFAPNHKGMPMLGPDDDLDFLRKQVLTARNVHGSWFNDRLLGGLNYQIEHHLFPSLPRPHLRKAQPIVEAYCAANGISYESTTLLRSYQIGLRYLYDVAAPLREHADAGANVKASVNA